MSITIPPVERLFESGQEPDDFKVGLLAKQSAMPRRYPCRNSRGGGLSRLVIIRSRSRSDSTVMITPGGLSGV